MKILRILFSITIAMLISVVLGSFLDVNALWIAGALLIFSFLTPRPQGALMVSLMDLARPSGDNVGGGGGIDSEIILIMAEDVDQANFPARSTLGGKITGNIPMKSGKYMHRFYSTDKTIKPTQKKLKGSNSDCGCYEVGAETFHPGLAEAALNWISNFGFAFKGYVIIQVYDPGASSSGTPGAGNIKRYLLGEPGNPINVDDLESMWGEDADKEKGTKIIFKGKQSRPIAIYEGTIAYDPGSASW